MLQQDADRRQAKNSSGGTSSAAVFCACPSNTSESIDGFRLDVLNAVLVRLWLASSPCHSQTLINNVLQLKYGFLLVLHSVADFRSVCRGRDPLKPT